MKSLKFASLIALALLSAHTAFAQVTVKDPWVRASVPRQKSTGAFMQLTATQDKRLVEARSPVANAIELHKMAMEGDVMKMRAVPGIDLPAGKAVQLKPGGGYHVMLIDLKQQLKEGDIVPITLVVEDKEKKRETIELKVPVRALNTAASSPGKY